MHTFSWKYNNYKMEHKAFSSHADTSLESNSLYVCDEEEVLI